MSSHPAHRPARSLLRLLAPLITTTTVVAGGGTGVVGLAPAASAATPVGDYPALQAAVGPGCVDGAEVLVTGPITAPTEALVTGCTVTIDLNDQAVSLRTITIASDETLTLTDNGSSPATRGSVVTVNNRPLEPGIQTTLATLEITGPVNVTASSTSTGAGVGGGPRASAGTLTVSGTATLTAQGGLDSAGIGGSASGGSGTTVVSGAATVTATGGLDAAGIGGGSSGDGGVTTISGGTVTAAGGRRGAGIGGGHQGDGGTTTVTGGVVTAASRDGGAGVGGGFGGDGVTTTVSGGSLDARGSDRAAGIGGGVLGDGGITTVSGDGEVTALGGDEGAGIGGGRDGDGGDTTVLEGATVSATGGEPGSAGAPGGPGVGGAGSSTSGGQVLVQGGIGRTARLDVVPGDGASAIGVPFGQPGTTETVVQDGVINVPSGEWRLGRGSTQNDVLVDRGGVVESRSPDPNTAPTGRLTSDPLASGPGQIDNLGAITLPTAAIDDDLVVLDHHYEVTFAPNGRGAELAAGENPVEVFAASFADGERAFPADPTRPGFQFVSWNSAADGRGTPITATSELPGEAEADGPEEITAYAQWRSTSQPPTPPQPPTEQPLPDVDASIDGEPKVGERLTASASLDSAVEGVSYAYQWLRDGAPIDGADSRTYRPGRADVAREVSVRVTASAPGRETSSGTSRAVAIRPAVGIIGVTRVGEDLAPRVAVPDGARASYRWETSQRPARGRQRVWEQVATGSSYTLRGRDAGTRVRLVVTISGPGFSEVRSVSVGRFVRR